MNNIQPQFLSFAKLLEKRLFRIPPYQRAYSWGRNHRRVMFDDILKLKDNPNNSHFMATIVGLHTETIKISTDEYEIIDIVDGQQRLTTLVILFKIIEKTITDSLTDDDRQNRTEEARIELELQELLVKPDKASLILLQTNHDLSQYFAKFIREGTISPESEANTLADRELLRAFQECKSYIINEWSDTKDLLHILKNRLFFIFHHIEDHETVHTIFEVLNNRGLDVSPLEILKNKLMEVVFSKGQGNHDRHISELHQIWGDFYRTVGLREEVPVDIDALGFGATLRAEKPPSRVFGDNAAESRLMSEKQMNVRKTIEISNWLVEVAKSITNFQVMIRKPLTDIRQARLLGIAILLREGFTDEERRKLLHQWEKTTFRIYGLCDNDARTAVGDYVKLAWKTYNRSKLSCDDILVKIPEIEANHDANHNYEIHDIDFYTKPKQRERLRYLLYRYEEYLAKENGQRFRSEQWNRIWEASASDSIEHILPQSKAGKDVVHLIGNLLLLPRGLNSELRANDPTDKIQEYMNTGLLIASDVANTIDEYQEWNADHIHARTEDIRDWIISEY